MTNATPTLGRDLCGDWNEAIGREWVVTNGLGGYACGTVSGAQTRRYHGFLMASFNPPVDRTLLVSKVDIEAEYRGKRYRLSANEFADGTIDPRGYVHLESFTVRDGVPLWRYAIADALVTLRVFMAAGKNTSYLRLEALRASAPLQIELKPLVTYRDYHSHGRGIRPFNGIAGDRHCIVQAFVGARPYRLAVTAGRFTPSPDWFWNFLHREELARGLDAIEDLWGPGIFSAPLAAGQSLVFTATAEDAEPAPGEEVLAACVARSRRLQESLPRSAPCWIRTLATASDQFIVRRGAHTGISVIAGYPWFTDWGRDTMIALPGLATALGRHDIAAAVLRTYARFVDRGMLPNRFSDNGEALEYNTVDATLWMFQALHEHCAAKPDPSLARDLYPTLTAIVHAHVEGTRYGIKVDPSDGLLRAGEPGMQLTWMDAKHGDQVFTARIGKPVEVNALWLNALDVVARLAERLNDAVQVRFCRALLERASGSFARFWNDAENCLYDVLDGGDLPDASIRPNQIFAVSLPYSPLTPSQMRAVVDRCGQDLLTSYGLRSLSADDPAYRGVYAGDAGARDAAYHQGTAWSWLLGPFVRAHHRVHGDAAAAMTYLEPMAQHLTDACVGSISEIFDGDAPHIARGCFAQAWGVAEILRSWLYLDHRMSKA